MMTTSAKRPMMVVEDSDDDFDTLVDALSGTGLDIALRRAVSGDQCLAFLHEKEPVLPQMILLDLSTPGLDGRYALEEIKADPRLKPIPVVVFTASSNTCDLLSCYEAGANAYHIKPVHYPDHLKIVQDIACYWFERVALPSRNGRGQA
jgi:CheY-like chemotaxis protein